MPGPSPCPAHPVPSTMLCTCLFRPTSTPMCAFYLPGAAYLCSFLPACTSTRSYHLLLLGSYLPSYLYFYYFLPPTSTRSYLPILLLVPTMQHVHIPTHSYMLHVYMFVEGFDRGSTEVRQLSNPVGFDRGSTESVEGSTVVRQRVRQLSTVRGFCRGSVEGSVEG